MRITSLTSFKKHLSDAAPAHLSFVYLLLSKDSLELKLAYQGVKQAFFFALTEKDRAQSVNIFNAENLRLAALSGALENNELFSRKRLLYLQQVDLLPKPAMEKIQSYLLSPNPGLCLVLSASALLRTTSFYKNLEKQGIVFEPASEGKEKEAELTNWVITYFFEAHRKISHQAAVYLVINCGFDRYCIANEMEKILCYFDDGDEVTLPTIQKFLAPLCHENIWHLAEQLEAKNGAAARRIARQVISADSDFFSFIRLMRMQFQTLAQICSLLMRGASSDQVQSHFPHLKGTLLSRNCSLAMRAGFTWLKNALILIDQAELRAKNGFNNYFLIIDILLSKLV